MDQLEFDLGVPRIAPPQPQPAPPPIPRAPAPGIPSLLPELRPSARKPNQLPPEPRPSTRRARPKPGPKPTPFHYTNAMWDVVRDVVATMEEFRHVDLDRVLLSIAQARQKSQHGTYASCYPLRFVDGTEETVQRGHRFRMPKVYHEGREMLYILYFTLPRFHQEQDYPEKLATVIHELYHISPHFNGDIRRFPGKNFAHGHSREVYHDSMRKLATRYLATSPRAEQHDFLKVSFDELLRHPGGVVGTSVPRPKPYLVEKAAATTRRRR